VTDADESGVWDVLGCLWPVLAAAAVAVYVLRGW
jgi:hypothetical protein